MNEWDFAQKVMNLIEMEGKAEFKIKSADTKNISPFSFKGVLVDVDQNEYKIEDEEAIRMFKELLETHLLAYSIDHEDKIITLEPQ